MELTHVDKNGPCMVDVSQKNDTERVAKAHGKVKMKKETIELLLKNETPKGDVLTTAKIAAIMGGKKTSEIIPMCHNIFISKIDVSFEVHESDIEIFSIAKATDKTGVEMEALTAVSVAALTIYDMLKAVDKGMEIGEIYLLSKSGGKSGNYVRG